MSVTASQALAALRTQVGTGFAFTIYWHGDDPPTNLDAATPFAYAVFDNEGSGRAPAAYGGGRGANLYRNEALLSVYMFSPVGEGASVVMDYAEQIAARLRSYRDASISCFSADVILIGHGSKLSVPGLSNEVNNYQCAVAEIALHFDQIG